MHHSDIRFGLDPTHLLLVDDAIDAVVAGEMSATSWNGDPLAHIRRDSVGPQGTPLPIGSPIVKTSSDGAILTEDRPYTAPTAFGSSVRAQQILLG